MNQDVLAVLAGICTVDVLCFIAGFVTGLMFNRNHKDKNGSS